MSKKDIESVKTREKYGELCPYYTLKLAMARCNYIFTVPQIEILKERVDLLIIDEEPTLSFYFPQCAEVCSYSHLPNKSSIQTDIPDLQYLKDQIEQKDRKVAYDRDALKAIAVLEQWKGIIIAFKDNEISVDKVIPALNCIPLPEFEDRDAAYRHIAKRLIAGGYSVFFDAVFYPAPIKFYKETGQWNNRIFAVADCEHQIRQFPQSDRILMIGATIAEKVAMTLEPNACKVIEFKSFHYAPNFVIFPVQDTQEIILNGKIYIRLNRNKTQNCVLNIAKTLYQHKIPCIVVTGSGRIQSQVGKELRKLDVPPEFCQQENIHEIVDNVLTGRPTIIYANSSVSRGIDLDIFDVNLIYHAEFSTPYWSAMEYYWTTEKNSQQACVYRNIREQILIDETVNLAFRIAPVKGKWEGYPKILFIPIYYLERLRVRCTELGVLDELNKATSKVTICPQKVDITNLGKILGAYIRSVVKNRENADIAQTKRRMGSNEGYEISDISNQYPDLAQNNPILGAVREGRLVESLVGSIEGLMLNDTERLVHKGNVPAYLEHIIQSLVTEGIRTNSPVDKNGVSTMDLIGFVQSPSTEWIANNPDVIMPDARNKLGRPQKYLATREQVRKVLKRMNADGTIRQTKRGRRDMWSLPLCTAPDAPQMPYNRVSSSAIVNTDQAEVSNV